MSHHLDTPLAAQNGQLYIDDLYVFPGEGSTVFVLDVNSNITGVYAQPGFHPEARYEFKVHFGGADFEALTYRVAFGEAGADGSQSLRLYTLAGADAREDSAAGELVLEGRTGQAASAGGIRIWAGRTQDSFYIDLSLLAHRQRGGGQGHRAGPVRVAAGGRAEQFRRARSSSRSCWRSPTPHPLLRPGARTGVWAATKLATDAGGWRQINRAGHPMMWPIFWPDDIDFSNPANIRHPSEDVAAAAKCIGERVAAVVAASGTSDDPEGYGQTVARQPVPRRAVLRGRHALRSTGSPASTAGPWPTTRPRPCSPWSPTWRCPAGSSRRWPRTSAPPASPTSSQPDYYRTHPRGLETRNDPGGERYAFCQCRPGELRAH